MVSLEIMVDNRRYYGILPSKVERERLETALELRDKDGPLREAPEHGEGDGDGSLVCGGGEDLLL